MPRSYSTIWSDVSSTFRIGLTIVVLMSELSQGSRVYVVRPPQIALRRGFEYWLCSLPSLNVGLCSLSDLKIGSQLNLRLLGWYRRHLLQWCRWFFVTIGPPVHLHPWWLKWRANCLCVVKFSTNFIDSSHCLFSLLCSSIGTAAVIVGKRLKGWYLGPEMRLIMIRVARQSCCFCLAAYHYHDTTTNCQTGSGGSSRSSIFALSRSDCFCARSWACCALPHTIILYTVTILIDFF